MSKEADIDFLKSQMDAAVLKMLESGNKQPYNDKAFPIMEMVSDETRQTIIDDIGAIFAHRLKSLFQVDLSAEYIDKPQFTGDDVYHLRNHLGLSQQEFSEAVLSNLISRETIARFERGAKMSYKNRVLLCTLVSARADKVKVKKKYRRVFLND